MSTTKDFPSRNSIIKSKRIPLSANVKALMGTLAAINLAGASEGMATPGANDPDLLAVGFFLETVDNTGGAAGAKTVDVKFLRPIEVRHWLNDSGTPVTAADFGKPVYFFDNNTVTGSPTGSSIAGICWGLDADGRVMVEPTTRFIPSADAAGSVSIADTASLFASTDVEGALAEVANNVAYVPLNILASLVAATGAPLAVFADGAFTVPGTELTNSKACSVRWNNHATPGALTLSVAMPEDYDEGSDAIVHFIASKIGATLGDATKFTVGVFENRVGALHDADVDFGGDSSAMVGDAATKTVQEVTLTLALANLNAAPNVLTFTIKPKAGTLGTDDVVLHGAYIEIVRKNVAA